MKNLVFITIVCLIIISGGVVLTIIGILNTTQLKYVVDFPSDVLGEERHVVVYQPPTYELKLFSKYPVLYIFGGQQLYGEFENGEAVADEWSLKQTLDRLNRNNQIEEVVVVAVYDTENDAERLTGADPVFSSGEQVSAEVRFFEEELQPYIQQRYRVHATEHVAVAGFSYGGLRSLAIGLHAPEKLTALGSLSAPLGWREHEIEALLAQNHRAHSEVDTTGGESPTSSKPLVYVEKGHALTDYTGSAIEDWNEQHEDVLQDIVQLWQEQGYVEGTDLIVAQSDGAETLAERVEQFLLAVYGVEQ